MLTNAYLIFKDKARDLGREIVFTTL
jgi:hypothetical protein